MADLSFSKKGAFFERGQQSFLFEVLKPLVYYKTGRDELIGVVRPGLSAVRGLALSRLFRLAPAGGP